tara:strand:+ start:1443 stop:1637 length:195 start_codon:yes stop_codon:yes gene_type:complete
MFAFDKKYINASIDFCKTLNGQERVSFITEALEDYYFALDQKSPLIIQRRFRELYTKLVKNFGH